MNKLPARTRIMPIHRWAGVVTQFERTNGGYLFRRHGCGPAVFVTPPERDRFAAAGMRALLIHAAAFAFAAGIIWLVVGRVLAEHGDTMRAIVFGIVASLSAMALYASQQSYADAPGRALAHRPIVQPARDPDFTTRQSYGGIIATTLLLLFLAAIGTEQPASFYIVVATCAVMLGLFLAVRRWLFDAGLSATQRRQADQVERELAAKTMARAKANPQTGGQVVLLLAFVVGQLVVLLCTMLIGVATAAAIVGQSSEQLTFGVFMIGFVGGLALGGLLMVPLDRLCKRLTGSSASDSFSWLPMNW